MVKGLIKVEWLDANQSTLQKEFINNLKAKDSGKELLFINTTYGKLGPVLKDVVVIIHEESNNSCDVDVTIIPRKWIISPRGLM